MGIDCPSASPVHGVVPVCLSPFASLILPFGGWDSNPGPPEEQPVLLTSEPSHQPLDNGFFERLYFLKITIRMSGLGQRLQILLAVVVRAF